MYCATDSLIWERILSAICSYFLRRYLLQNQHSQRTHDSINKISKALFILAQVET